MPGSSIAVDEVQVRCAARSVAVIHWNRAGTDMVRTVPASEARGRPGPSVAASRVVAPMACAPKCLGEPGAKNGDPRAATRRWRDLPDAVGRKSWPSIGPQLAVNEPPGAGQRCPGGGLYVFRFWSRRGDSNSRPTVYESAIRQSVGVRGRPLVFKIDLESNGCVNRRSPLSTAVAAAVATAATTS